VEVGEVRRDADADDALADAGGRVVIDVTGDRGEEREEGENTRSGLHVPCISGPPRRRRRTILRGPRSPRAPPPAPPRRGAGGRGCHRQYALWVMLCFAAARAPCGRPRARGDASRPRLRPRAPTENWPLQMRLDGRIGRLGGAVW